MLIHATFFCAILHLAWYLPPSQLYLSIQIPSSTWFVFCWLTALHHWIVPNPHTMIYFSEALLAKFHLLCLLQHQALISVYRMPNHLDISRIVNIWWSVIDIVLSQSLVIEVNATYAAFNGFLQTSNIRAKVVLSHCLNNLSLVQTSVVFIV